MGLARVLAAKYLIYGDAGISLLLSLYLTPNGPTTIADYHSQLSLQDLDTDLPVVSVPLATTLDVKSCPSLLPPTPLSPPSPLGFQDTGHVSLTIERGPPLQACNDRSSLSPLSSPMPSATDQHPETHTVLLSCDSSAAALVLPNADSLTAQRATDLMASHNIDCAPRQAIDLLPNSKRSSSSLYSTLPLADVAISQQNQLEGSLNSRNAPESPNIASGVEQGLMSISPSIPVKRKPKVGKENFDSPPKKSRKSEPLPNPSKRQLEDSQIMILAQQPERITRSKIAKSTWSGTKSVINREKKA